MNAKQRKSAAELEAMILAEINDPRLMVPFAKTWLRAGTQRLLRGVMLVWPASCAPSRSQSGFAGNTTSRSLMKLRDDVCVTLAALPVLLALVLILTK
jgi:hypothetical protein